MASGYKQMPTYECFYRLYKQGAAASGYPSSESVAKVPQS